MKGIRKMLKKEDAFPVCDYGAIGAAIINSAFGCFTLCFTPMISICAALPAVMVPVMLQGK